MKILSVVGARPNFVKIAPIIRRIAQLNEGRAAADRIGSVLVHTEQHYDDAMSSSFFRELDIPPPDCTLGVGSASHAVQTAEIMRRFEPVLVEERPDVVIVVGDVNSTAACSLTAAKLGIKIAHVEAGLRSFDRSMPEEINRVVTDALSDIFFTTEASANENLRREGQPADRIVFVGNVMIDSLMACRRLADRSDILDRFGIGAGAYALVTLHRPSNVDDAGKLSGILGALSELATHIPVLLPAHPRTLARIEEFGLASRLHPVGSVTDGCRLENGDVHLLSPLGYLDFLRLMSDAKLVLTDSGGIQDETTCLGVTCLTLRNNTERPVTLTEGTSTLVGNDPKEIIREALFALEEGRPRAATPPLWDGRASERIVSALLERL